MKRLFPKTTCTDGTVLSIQASSFHYCSPRGDHGPWEMVEVGYIRDNDGKQLLPPPTWEQYADSGELKSEVYGYVPKPLVLEFLLAHGVPNILPEALQ